MKRDGRKKFEIYRKAAGIVIHSKKEKKCSGISGNQ